jgi:hypothetical protein
MKKIISVIALSIPTILLGACGGGGDSSSASPTIAPSSVVATTLDGLSGNYVAACEDLSYKTYMSATPQASESSVAVAASRQASIVITPANVVTAHFQYYEGSADCMAATLAQDVTATGQLTAKAASKNYMDATGKKITASVATFSFNGMKISKGSFTGSFPTPGATTDIAYVLNGNTLNVAKGHREADGLGDSLSKPFVKQ